MQTTQSNTAVRSHERKIMGYETSHTIQRVEGTATGVRFVSWDDSGRDLFLTQREARELALALLDAAGPTDVGKG